MRTKEVVKDTCRGDCVFRPYYSYTICYYYLVFNQKCKVYFIKFEMTLCPQSLKNRLVQNYKCIELDWVHEKLVILELGKNMCKFVKIIDLINWFIDFWSFESKFWFLNMSTQLGKINFNFYFRLSFNFNYF